MYYYAKMHRGARRLFVRFPFDKATTAKIKEIAPCLWSITEKAWYFEASNTVFIKLREAFPQLQPIEPTTVRAHSAKEGERDKP
jgi:hypothetical protein